jgi:SAM-dependent methyltransferase
MQSVVRIQADRILRRVSSSYRLSRKHDAELDYWRGELKHLGEWFRNGTTDWWGIRPPRPAEKLAVSDLWTVNAVMTMHAMRPSYTEELRLDVDAFSDKRVLEIGSGPLCPILQFTGCVRHCIDPLTNLYIAAGWPLFEYDAHCIDARAESLPYPDGYFHAAISVNALDHVDDFAQTASEMQRVVRPGGGVYFEVEYHPPSVTEPIELSDARVVRAFSRCTLQTVITRSGEEMYQALARRFGLVADKNPRFGDERFITWHGTRT